MAPFHYVTDQWNISKQEYMLLLLELEAKNNENENKNHKSAEIGRA